MGLTLPWEPRCLDFHCCYFRRLRLGGASVLQRSCVRVLGFTAAISLQPLSHLDPRILNENAKALQSVLHMEPELQGCLFDSGSIFILPPSSWFESLDRSSTVLILISPIIQVLHLMNKMNLPCPFGPVTARPPMVSYTRYCWRQTG